MSMTAHRSAPCSTRSRVRLLCLRVTGVARQFSGLIPGFDHRHEVKPGITGWAQVNYPYGASVEDARNKLAYDLYYIKTRSLSLELRILLATVRVVIFQEGAR